MKEKEKSARKSYQTPWWKYLPTTKHFKD